MSEKREGPGRIARDGAPPPRRRAVHHRFGVGRIALRQLRSRASLAVALGLSLAAAATLVASVVLIQSRATDEGLRSALAAAGQGANVLLERDGISQPAAFDAFQRDAATRVRTQLGDAVTAGAEFGKSLAVTVRTIDGVLQGPPVTWNPSVVSYTGLNGHVHIAAGRWPDDARVGADWQFTASARATDDLGGPLGLHVGSEYCFQYLVRARPVTEIWCGRLTGTWLPNNVSDPYWAGQVPDPDVSVGHDSYFQILAQMPDGIGGAEQQYVPAAANIPVANTDRVVKGVNQLRGYYSVSSNDVFISGLDTTITGFLSRQSAASGPTLVTALGLLVVAVAAMGFAALQFIQGHIGQAALWRARGWSRARVWSLFTLEFAVLAAVATPLAIVASAGITSAVGNSSATHPALSWQSFADAAVPALIAEGGFLMILALLAAARSGPELSQRRRDRSAISGRSWQRRGVDAALFAAGVGILVFVRFGGADPAGNGQGSGVVLALPLLAVGLLAFASLRLVAFVARILTASRGVAARLARWQVERDPAQYSRLCLLITLAVAVGVFASTYTASDRASAIDRADYMVGADMRATFSSAASPPQLAALSASLPSGVRSAQAFRDVGRPGRTGTDATILGIQGTGFWDIAYQRSDFASPSLRALTSRMTSTDPDGSVVPGTPRALSMSVYSSGLDARIEVEITDANGRVLDLPLSTLGRSGWTDVTASLSAAPGPITYPVRVRAVTVLPTGPRATGDVAVQNLRTDSGAVVESFATADGWWQEAFAPDPAEAPLTPTLLHAKDARPSVDIPINLQEIRLLPPPTSRPLPVLLASQTMSALGVSIGQSFPLHLDTVDVQLVPVGSFDEFPTYYPSRGDLLVVPMVSLLDRLGNLGATSPWANELWLSVPGSRVSAVTAAAAAQSTLLQTFLRSDAETLVLNDPLRRGLDEELGLGFLVALAVVVIGFGLQFLAAARNRVTHFAIMRANGIPRSVLRRSLVAEQIAVLISGLIAGTAIGLALAWAVLPIFHLGTLPEDLIPPSVFHLDPLTLVAVVLGTGALALVVGRMVAGSGSRVDVMATVRSLA